MTSFKLHTPSSIGFHTQTSQKCPLSHPVQIHDSNHTHSLTSFQYSWLLANDHPSRLRKKKNFFARSEGPTRPEYCFFFYPFVQRGENCPPSANHKTFYSQTQTQPCSFPPLGESAHLLLPHPFYSWELKPKGIGSDITS